MDKTWNQKIELAEKALSAADPILASLINRFGPYKITPHTDYYRQLVRSIIGQQLSVKAAESIYNRFIELFEGTMPSPEQIISTDVEALRKIGCSYSKANYIRDLAQHIIDGRLDLDDIATLSNETVIEQLVAVKGIGEWSAHMFMMFSLGRLDILPTGDLGVRKAMMLLYDLPELPKPPVMHEIALLHHWAPYQSVASWYLWESLDTKPA
jgi:DNA-3-methyladenine glycosylase II